MIHSIDTRPSRSTVQAFGKMCFQVASGWDLPLDGLTILWQNI